MKCWLSGMSPVALEAASPWSADGPEVVGVEAVAVAVVFAPVVAGFAVVWGGGAECLELPHPARRTAPPATTSASFRMCASSSPRPERRLNVCDDRCVEQRLSLVTLGVADLAVARRFYEALGWRTGAEPDDDVVFFQAGSMIVALWSRSSLADDSGVEDAGGWGGVALAYNTRSPAEVDEVLEEARAARATIAREGAANFWGGHSGVLVGPHRQP